MENTAELGNRLLQGSYHVDLARSLNEGWLLLKRNLVLCVGASLIIIGILAALHLFVHVFVRQFTKSIVSTELDANLRVSLASIPGIMLAPILYAGLCSILLKRLRGQPASLKDVFAGFGPGCAQLALAGLAMRILTFIGLLFCILPGIYLYVAWFFTVPLIVDRRLGFWTAMELSRKIITRQWWIFLCLAVIMAAALFAGLLACCVGIVVTFPFAYAVLISTYEHIINRSSA